MNRVIGALERGGHAFSSFLPAERDAAIEFGAAAYDGLIFEMEHKPWDPLALRDAFQYLFNGKQIHQVQAPGPAVTPMVRIPPNGSEMAQWHAKQALDLGAFGIIWPHISTVEQARNAVSACRYPFLPDSGRPGPAGLRGDGPTAACRYWGLPNTEYYAKSDVWPLAAEGELLVGLMIEDQQGVDNLQQILDEVPGIGLILIGEGDMSQELGVARQYEHPAVMKCKKRILDVCGSRGVAVGHPHVTVANVEQVIEDGYRFLMAAPVRSYAALDRARSLTCSSQHEPVQHA